MGGGGWGACVCGGGCGVACVKGAAPWAWAASKGLHVGPVLRAALQVVRCTCAITPLLSRYCCRHPPSPTRQDLMRADFTLFDEFEHTHGGAPPFAFPVTAFYGNRDRRIKRSMVEVHFRGGGGGRKEARRGWEGASSHVCRAQGCRRGGFHPQLAAWRDGPPRPAHVRVLLSAGLAALHHWILPAAGGGWPPPVAAGQGQQGGVAYHHCRAPGPASGMTFRRLHRAAGARRTAADRGGR